MKVLRDEPDRKRFFTLLLNAAGLGPVDENFSEEYGDDPKVTIYADFLVAGKTREGRTADKVILNIVDNTAACMPPQLVGFMAGKGYRVVQSCESPAVRQEEGIRLSPVASLDPSAITDLLLQASGIKYQSRRSVGTFTVRDSNKSFDFVADRYFEDRGKRVIVYFADGDPVRQGLLRLVSREGYQLAEIGTKDDLPTIAGKLFSNTGQGTEYVKHDLIASDGGPYTVEISGLLLPAGGSAANGTLVTDVPLVEPFTRLLLETVWEEE